MDYLSELHHNLTTGDSYLTQNSDDPETDGQIIYDNIEAVAEILFGDESTDEDYEYLVDAVSGGFLNAYDPDFDPAEAAHKLDARAKARGGAGWLS